MNYIQLTARIFLALIFVLSGLDKISNFEAMQGYMSAMGVPTFLLAPTILLEVLGGLAIIIGFKVRIAAAGLAFFCVISALLFHNNLADQTQFIMFMKNIAMAGGFLMLLSLEKTPLSLDNYLASKN